MRPSIDSATMG